MSQPKQDKPSVKIEDTFRELGDWMLALQRAGAGYNKLSGAFANSQGIKSTGRAQGLPIFEMPATITGVDSVKVVLDLKDLDPQYLQHVLVPLANMAGQQVLEALDEVELRFAAIREHFTKVLTTPQT